MTNLANHELSPEELYHLGPNRLLVRVRAIIYEGENINAYEVTNPQGGLLPPFEPGSHIDLYFRDQRIRQYSLCSDPRERWHYIFAVQREPDGRGGSKAIFERVHVGRILTISYPRNNFPLNQQARRHLLLAGGIGITPIMAMVYCLRATSGNFTLHYCARSPQRTAFLDELKSLCGGDQIFIHHDCGSPEEGLDIVGLLKTYDEGTHLYYCGPNAFMAAVHKASEHWPAGSVHSEYFAASASAQPQPVPAEAMQDAIGVGFQVKIASTGAVFDVPNDKSIVQVLREHGIAVQTSCESGLCGTCKTPYLEGTPEHRDYILDDKEKEKYMLICCSRASSRMLVLDL